VEINTQENFWQAFAVSGDPLAYLTYAQYRNGVQNSGKRRGNENDKITGIGS
jgi:hypothetical protein